MTNPLFCPNFLPRSICKHRNHFFCVTGFISHNADGLKPSRTVGACSHRSICKHRNHHFLWYRHHSPQRGWTKAQPYGGGLLPPRLSSKQF